MKIIKPSVSMNSKPSKNSMLETECLFGESVEILSEDQDWIFCKLLIDNYLGWIKKDSVGFLKTPTHRVISQRTFLLTKKNEKSNYMHYIPMGAKVNAKKIETEWTEIYLSNNHQFETAFLPSKDIVTIDNKVSDWIGIAQQFLYTPYKWGGRDSIGIDCSALLQLSQEAYGRNIPRNSIDQVESNRKIITKLNNLFRGCVVFWRGHVALMIDNLNCIHANAFHMKVIIEPLHEVINRMPENNKIIKILDFN